MNEEVPIQLIRSEGKGRLLDLHGLPVLHLRGSPGEMGFQHGKLLPERVRQSYQAYVHEYAIEEQGKSLDELLEIFRRAIPFIPQAYLEEMDGLAEASDVCLDLVRAFHVLPTLWHCSGCAAMNEATADGKLYHYRSLDHSLEIGRTLKAQDNACITVWEPDDGVPLAAPSWIGALGIVSGMSAAGLSMGEMGSHCEDECFDGRPMWFQMREVLSRAETLDDGRRLMEEYQPDCGFNFILADGKIPDALVIEVTHTRKAFFRPGDPAEDQPPHFAIPHVVRRVNHFVSPELAATQRPSYDPSIDMPGSAMLYAKLSAFVQQVYGKLDAEHMIWLCRQYPPEHHCLHQAVFCPIDGDFWVATAVNPNESPTPGAQNQPFLPFNLNAILEFEG